MIDQQLVQRRLPVNRADTREHVLKHPLPARRVEKDGIDGGSDPYSNTRL